MDFAKTTCITKTPVEFILKNKYWEKLKNVGLVGNNRLQEKTVIKIGVYGTVSF